jgi:hypothetical protein
MAEALTEYLTSVIGGIVGIVVVANLISPAVTAANSTGVAILAPIVVGSVLGAGLIMFIVRTFF